MFKRAHKLAIEGARAAAAATVVARLTLNKANMFSAVAPGLGPAR